MKALILAAGFGTRLKESFQNYNGQYKKQLEEWVGGKPKGLVLIKGKPVIDYQLEQLLQAGLSQKDLFIQTNAWHYPHYLSWAEKVGIPFHHVFNNGIYDNEHRLGAVADLQYALARMQREEVLVLASDTLLFLEGENLFPFQQLIEKYKADGTARIVVYAGEIGKLSRHGIIEVDAQHLVIGFEEKPSQPKSNLVNASVHLYTQGIVDDIMNYSFPPRAEAGQVIARLYPHHAIKVDYAVRRVDLGTVEDVLRENVAGGSA